MVVHVSISQDACYYLNLAHDLNLAGFCPLFIGISRARNFLHEVTIRLGEKNDQNVKVCIDEG